MAGLFPGARHYLDTYGQHGLVTPRSVFAHNVHPSDAELALLADGGASVAHCPTSNSALGSGLFPLRGHVEHGIHVALGSDVGAGAGLSHAQGGAAGLLHPATARCRRASPDAGAPAVPGHPGRSAGARPGPPGGDFQVGKDFDAVWLRPAAGSTLAVNLRHARDTTDALARIFALATPADVAGVWIRGERAAAQPAPG